MDDWLDRAFSEIDGAPRLDARTAVARDGRAVADSDVPAPQHGMRLTPAEPTYAETTYAELARAEPAHAEADYAEPPHLEPPHREPDYVEAPVPHHTPAPNMPAPHVPAPAVTESAATAPAPPPTPHDSPVIGRYESDDTSYVMYADGSIEAQSSAGVYRFSSMAELKAFIEG